MTERKRLTPCGWIQGVEGKEPGITVYKGIRYARAGRWEYPKQVAGWDGVYMADHFGNCSWQPRAFYNEADMQEKAFYYHEFREGEHYTYDEDCLFLNIWAPEDARHAPVLFYIHGGGFKGGCGHEKHFDGTAYCRRGVILVTINYRLGPLGFLSLPELKEEAGATGNYGCMDQLTALSWVRDNISAFGGDPERITIMGQSAGAMSVQRLCLSPLTKGMFAGAIMMSGGGVSKDFAATARAEDTYLFWQELMKRLAVSTLAELRTVGLAELFAEFQAMCRDNPLSMVNCGPVRNGVFLTEPESETVKRGDQRAVPYLMGSTSEDIVPPIVYRMAKGWARLQADQGKCPSYAFFFDRQLPGDDKGAWHSSDLWYEFGSLENCWRPFTEWDYELSGMMVEYFANFVKTGNPNGAGLPIWEPEKKGQNKVMRFGDKKAAMGGVSVAKLNETMRTNPGVGE
ncbi:MAG: carboxylesterase family protein [Eubacteriales bacterium]|nr:carboxylesterase family protein [Eubacteriales bacterium]